MKSKESRRGDLRVKSFLHFGDDINLCYSDFIPNSYSVGASKCLAGTYVIKCSECRLMLCGQSDDASAIFSFPRVKVILH